MALDVEGWGRAIALIAFPSLLLAACASPPVGSEGYPVPGVGTYRVGEPYQIKGVWYYPTVDYNYDRTGIASWYGEEFEGRLTANGEIFDLNALTAAHTTLPMPSIVQVTNLENGRSLQLRVNDRGPFVDGRLIDVSRRAAQLLGFESRGTTLVRMTILKDESIAAAEEAMHNSAAVMVAATSGLGTPLSKAEGAQVAFSGPRRAARKTRAIEPAPATQIATSSSERYRPPMTQTAMIAPVPPAGLPLEPARQPVTAMLRRLPPSKAPAAHYRFSLISSAQAAELPGLREALRKHEAAYPAAPVAKGPAGRIFIQAGAFTQRDNAERAERRVSHWGSAQLTPALVKGVAMYRVRIGPIPTEAQARELLARVINSGYPEAHVVGE